jgi:ABC-2 type transport system ATP-binding protein
MIEVSSVTKRFGNRVAVNDLSFTAEPGKIYGFLGPNGAGKTTTMNIITGYLAPTEGTVLIDGADIMKDPENIKKKIGYLPETPPVYPDMTVREYLNFAAELKGISKSDRNGEVMKVMAATGTDGSSERLIRNLSKGYRQRVGLAQALIGDPEILILDEPTVGLDPEQQKEMFDYIVGLKEDRIIILSSHILADISMVADYVWIINNGELIASDTIENLSSGMTASQVVTITVQGESEKIREALDPLDVVTGIEITDLADGSLEVKVTSDSAEDVRPALSRAVSGAGAAILSMNNEKKSLEEVFLSLTEEPAAEETEARPEEAPEAEPETDAEAAPEAEPAAAPEADEEKDETEEKGSEE